MGDGIRTWSGGSLLFPQGLDGVLVGLSREHGLKGSWGHSMNGALYACQCCRGGERAGVRLGGSQKTNRAASLPFFLSFSSVSIRLAAKR